MFVAGTAALVAGPIPASLKSSLKFHASFDRGLQADLAVGEAQIYHAPDYKQQGEAKPGLGDLDVGLEKGVGVGGGDALRFRSKNTRALFFRGDRNVALSAGTISFWLRLDPDKDLAPGFCDPIQVTDKAYNDSAIWVDFTKDDVPRQFRFGAFGRLKSWNSSDLPPDKNPAFLQRLIVVGHPPFTRERWTHVVVTWSGLDSGKGVASLFLDGKRSSLPKDIGEAFEWDQARLAIRLGVNYIGLLDEVAVFGRMLDEAEVATLTKSGAMH
jgi:hypothetical protein